MNIFNPMSLTNKLARYKLLQNKPSYIYDELSSRISERLYDIRYNFNKVLTIGPCVPSLDEEKCQTMQSLDEFDKGKTSGKYDVIIDTTLHTANNPLDTLKSHYSLLNNQGCFLSVIPSKDTLFELRSSIQQTQQSLFNKITPHIHPTLRVQDTSSLLSSSAFSLITVDIDEIIVHYPSMWELIADLNAMGQGNSLSACSFLPRDVLIGAAAVYKSVYGNPAVPATFSFIFMVYPSLPQIGWRQDTVKAIKRGSADYSMKVLEGRSDE